MDANQLLQQLDRIEKTLDRLVPELSAIKTDLAYHIKRSDLLEARHEELEKNYQQLRGFFSIAGWILASFVAALSALHLLQFI